MIISIQQPEYFPWLGFFDKILSVDKVVFLDNVQFKKRYFENRNKIRTSQGWTWVNTPVITKGRFDQNIMGVMIDNSHPWQRKIISTLRHNYAKAPYWDQVGEQLCELISRPWDKLVDLNLAVIFFFLEKLDIKRECCKASSLDTQKSGSNLILEICKKMNATKYLSGCDGKNYLNEEDFIAEGIEVLYQDFGHPVYTQLHGEFMPAMSIADIYFNHGPESTTIIKSNMAVQLSYQRIQPKKIMPYI